MAEISPSETLNLRLLFGGDARDIFNAQYIIKYIPFGRQIYSINVQCINESNFNDFQEVLSDILVNTAASNEITKNKTALKNITKVWNFLEGCNLSFESFMLCQIRIFNQKGIIADDRRFKYFLGHSIYLVFPSRAKYNEQKVASSLFQLFATKFNNEAVKTAVNLIANSTVCKCLMDFDHEYESNFKDTLKAIQIFLEDGHSDIPIAIQCKHKMDDDYNETIALELVILLTQLLKILEVDFELKNKFPKFNGDGRNAAIELEAISQDLGLLTFEKLTMIQECGRFMLDSIESGDFEFLTSYGKITLQEALINIYGQLREVARNKATVEESSLQCSFKNCTSEASVYFQGCPLSTRSCVALNLDPSKKKKVLQKHRQRPKNNSKSKPASIASQLFNSIDEYSSNLEVKSKDSNFQKSYMTFNTKTQAIQTSLKPPPMTTVPPQNHIPIAARAQNSESEAESTPMSRVRPLRLLEPPTSFKMSHQQREHYLILFGANYSDRANVINFMYSLAKYQRFEEALAAPKLDYVIPYCFTVQQNVMNSDEVWISSDEDFEILDTNDQPKTKHMVTKNVVIQPENSKNELLFDQTENYIIEFKHLRLHVTNIPELFDAEALDKFQNQISGNTTSHSIIYVVNSNQASDASQLELSMRRLISLIPAKNLKNIYFFFTRSETLQFELEKAVTPLKELVDKLRETNGIEIPLGPENCYLTENGSYRWLAAQKQGLQYSGMSMDQMKDGWEKSAQEVHRFLNTLDQNE